MTKQLDNDIKFSSYIDDFIFYYSHKDLNFLQQKMNSNLQLIADWCNANGFIISTEKTNFIVFNKSKKTDNIKLQLNQKDVQKVSEIKYLGMIVDQKLNWLSHIKYTK